MASSQSPAPSVQTQSSPVMNPGDHTSGPRVINPGDQAGPGSHFQAEKRKMEPELGDVSGLNNPSKIPKMEPKTPGSPGMNHLNFC